MLFFSRFDVLKRARFRDRFYLWLFSFIGVQSHRKVDDLAFSGSGLLDQILTELLEPHLFPEKPFILSKLLVAASGLCTELVSLLVVDDLAVRVAAAWANDLAIKSKCRAVAADAVLIAFVAVLILNFLPRTLEAQS